MELLIVMTRDYVLVCFFASLSKKSDRLHTPWNLNLRLQIVLEAAGKRVKCAIITQRAL